MSRNVFRDTSGRTLEDYPRPSVAVDTAVLTLDPEHGLAVLQVRRGGKSGWALPGTFLHEGETLTEAVERSLRDKANVRGLCPRQLHVFDDPKRDDRGWVLSVAHVAVVQANRLDSRFPDTTRIVPISRTGRLAFDHDKIIVRAVEHVRSRYADEPDPDGLLDEEFTLRQLRIAHEAVLGYTLQRDTFRRAMESHLVPTGSTTVGTRGRPAELFRRRETESKRRRGS